MLISLNYREYVGAKLKYTSKVDSAVKGKALALVEVDEETVIFMKTELKEVGSDAIFRYRGGKGVLMGEDFTGLNLVIEVDATEVEEKFLPAFVQDLVEGEVILHPSITHVLTLGQEVKNLRMLESLSKQFPNVRYKGVEMLNIPTVNIGYADINMLLNGKPSSEAVLTGEVPIINKTSDIEIEVISGKKKPQKKKFTLTGSGKQTQKKIKEPKEKKEKPEVKKKYDLSFM